MHDGYMEVHMNAKTHELWQMLVIYIQVNEKSCRLRMGTYRDRVKRKGDKIVMGL